MFACERHEKIAGLVRERGRVSTTQLQRQLLASVATIRRDLIQLEQAGHLLRTHGGAIRPGTAGGEATFARKAQTAVAAKQAIALRAAELVPPNAAVFVDAGTTTLEAARRLLPRADLTLFTNSLPLLNLRAAGQARVVAIGGELREISCALVGGLALEWLKHLRFDCALLGASGLDPVDGASTTELAEAEVKKEFARRARRVLLLADASKWRRPAPVVFAGWSAINDWICDAKLTRPERAALQKQGVTVHSLSHS